MKTQAGIRQLRQLAGLYGVQTAYYDVRGQRQSASAESLLAVLRAMAAPVETPADAPAAIDAYAQQRWSTPLEPVLIAWEGELSGVELRLPERDDLRLGGELVLEDGERERFAWRASSLPTTAAASVGGRGYVAKAMPFERKLPYGYHHLTLDVAGVSAQALILSAPIKSYVPARASGGKGWGIFLPLYAMRGQRNWGGGSFSDLQQLIDWVADMGGEVVATLPLLATFLGEPFEPSPYSPVSRLMWNPFYLDLERWRGRKATGDIDNALAVLQEQSLVDYQHLAQLKRQRLEAWLSDPAAQSAERAAELSRFADAHPQVADYAAFMAACEAQRDVWPQWPERMRRGTLRDGDYDAAHKDYHICAQWLCRRQLAELADKAKARGAGLYLDLPLGVHPHGYDAWRRQELFMHGARVGSPPDTFFTRGQDWGFAPLHPQRLREQHYGYLIEVIQHHLRHANILRLDHVMGLHRLYCIPPGCEARHGAYLRYPADELHAILSLESHRQQCWIIGENLGTVPDYVNRAMSRHGLGKMYVAQFEMTTDPAKALNPTPVNAVASFNTHDMPMFAAFWHGLDIDQRLDMGLIDEADAAAEKAALEARKEALIAFLRHRGLLTGKASAQAVHTACMAYLSASSANLVLVNLEDLWLETQPQNVPGTGQERPNWRRKTAHAFETFSCMPEVVDALRQIDALRKRHHEVKR